eukprot:GFYU01017548.1.p1 GENE.GFYU01017548.1~~GFYU01017548.1.p1  ORF type:complete len:995 (+),score=344.32 GFYU01017548.1:152-3136(+)
MGIFESVVEACCSNPQDMFQYRIGVDVGRSYTDAVLIKGKDIIRSCKTATTDDITSGIVAACKEVFTDEEDAYISAVVVGTSHFENVWAQHQTEHLSKVAVFRVCGPTTRSLPPGLDWPITLKEVAGSCVHYLSGGYQFNARAIIGIDEEEVRSATREAGHMGINAFAVVGVFSALNNDQETKVANIIKSEMPDAHVTMSHEIGDIGLVERENSTIMNTALKSHAKAFVDEVAVGLEGLKLECPLFFTSNDCTLLNMKATEEYPIKTFGCGVANAVRGGAVLSGIDDCVVVNVGNNSTTVGTAVHRLPRKSGDGEVWELGGIRVNAPTPAYHKVDIGGGSVVHVEAKFGNPQLLGSLRRESVRSFDTQALVHNGDVMTATDVAVAGGLTQLGDQSKVSDLDPSLVNTLKADVKAKLDDAIDVVSSKVKMPVVLVGGGSVIVASESFPNAARPQHYAVAGAVGAATAPVASVMNRVIVVNEKEPKAKRISKLTEQVKAEAVKNGAKRNTVEVVSLEEMPMPHLPYPSVRITALAVGELDMSNLAVVGADMTLSRTSRSSNASAHDHSLDSSRSNSMFESPRTPSRSSLHLPANDAVGILRSPTVSPIRPKSSLSGSFCSPVQVKESRGRLLTEHDLECIAMGTGILGCGSGSSSYNGWLRARELLRSGGEYRLIDPADIVDSDVIVVCALMGSNAVISEKPPRGDEVVQAIRRVESESGRFATMVAVLEIGGSNCMEALIAAAAAGLPLVDGDGMGRVFPDLQQSTYFINNGIKLDFDSLAVTADDRGRLSVVKGVASVKELQAELKERVYETGCVAGVALPLVNGKDAAHCIVPHTVSNAIELGDIALDARNANEDIAEKLSESGRAKEVFRGHIVNYTVSNAKTNMAEVQVIGDEGSQYKEKRMVVGVKGDFLVADLVERDGKKSQIASTPDLICLLNASTGVPLSADNLKYGQALSAVVLPCHTMLRTQEALVFVGPEYFGFPTTFKAVTME